MVARLRARRFGEAGLRDERGFTMIELMIAVLVSLTVLGSAATVISNVQSTYAYQMDDAAVQQELRFAMDFIRRTVEPAGSNPYNISTSDCPAANTTFSPITVNATSVRVMADNGTPDGLLVGSSGLCTEANEDVTIAFDGSTNTITRYDRGTDAAAVAWTDSVFTGLQFQYYDRSMAVTTTPLDVRVVRVTLTARSRTPRPGSATGATFTLSSDVRLKSK
jgi:Tfp pilus assembly protein PilW